MKPVKIADLTDFASLSDLEHILKSGKKPLSLAEVVDQRIRIFRQFQKTEETERYRSWPCLPDNGIYRNEDAWSRSLIVSTNVALRMPERDTVKIVDFLQSNGLTTQIDRRIQTDGILPDYLQILPSEYNRLEGIELTAGEMEKMVYRPQLALELVKRIIGEDLVSNFSQIMNEKYETFRPGKQNLRLTANFWPPVAQFDLSSGAYYPPNLCWSSFIYLSEPLITNHACNPGEDSRYTSPVFAEDP